MDRDAMIALVETHLRAEGAGDVEGAVSVYTEDIIHDEVGFPDTPRQGIEAAREVYRQITSNFLTEHEEPLNRFFDGDTMILEQIMTGRMVGEMFGIPGNGKRISFRILHIFGFRDNLISSEQVWVDGASVAAQLTAPE
jgi:steroid delta-isomerase-like uncharacterized protein